jgi:hypothetical protein
VNTIALTTYVLAWPVLVAIVMFVIARGFLREWLTSRRSGTDLICPTCADRRACAGRTSLVTIGHEVARPHLTGPTSWAICRGPGG